MLLSNMIQDDCPKRTTSYATLTEKKLTDILYMAKEEVLAEMMDQIFEKNVRDDSDVIYEGVCSVPCVCPSPNASLGLSLNLSLSLRVARLSGVRLIHTVTPWVVTH